MRKAFKYRLYPTQPQARDLERTLSLCRQLYNAALQERREAYRRAGKSVGFYEQKRWLPEIRAELPEYKGIHSQVLQNVVERVDKAFQGFFRRVKEGEKPGYPRFKGQERYDSFTFPQAGTTGVKLQEDGKRVLIHGIGSVKMKLHRPLEGRLKTATLKREGDDWYIVFVCETEPKPLPENRAAIGIDLGTNPHFLIASDGEMVQAPRYFQKAQAKLATAQRNLSRKKRGSHRRKQARRRVAKLHRKIANQRKDFHHKTARKLVNAYGTIVHEDLNILGLARSRTAKGVLDAGWAQFLQILAYKAEEAGRRVVGVDPRHTSQDCPVCGYREKKPLWVRVFRCSGCGSYFHRDVASAINVLTKARTEPSGMGTAWAVP
ncbi:RNA-guided endonuclease InsQ/TnpB family protein [Meiothermus granaticius]|uniref:Transposase, IS605 OrfB family n=1 Tax=Meiothermus granaticius NBRC 107808 TaxID=1227551 RepID=A0A399F9C6_9DEIN|nr:RNA-guided endonuclease TnpB family protein [Meiothermus granaticius]RIH91512.1 transposase, IS605 OrfB family [Meiothermus granaticius NBRC 107808]GEM88245.1 transposase [Meiothermus granaticius NBRC 107808]